MKEWVEELFQEPNLWDLKKIEGSGYKEKLQPLLQEMLSSILSEKLPVILPYLDVERTLWFYVVGKDPQQLAELRGIVSAYLGGACIELDKVDHHNSGDPIEKIILKKYPKGYLRLHIHKAINKNKDRVYWVIATLNKLIRQYHERPLVYSTVRRPIGRILRDFFVAYNHHDYESAVVYYDELENRQLLSKRNLISLELQALSSGNRWNALLGHPSLPDIIVGRIPRRITLIVLRALLATSINIDNLENYDLDGFRVKYANFDSLFFRVPDISKTPEFKSEWKCWSIGAAAFGFGRLLEVLPNNIDGEWKDQLIKWASLSAPSDTDITSVKSLETLVNAQPSVEIAALLLRESVTASEDQARQIYLRVSEYPEALQKELFDNILIRQLWGVLDELHGDNVEVSNWPALFACIADATVCNDPIQIAIERSDYWEAETWDEQVLAELASGSNNYDSKLRDVLPILLPWLENRKLTLSADCIEQLLLNLATDTYISVQDLVLCGDLTGFLVGIPHTKLQYSMAIEAIQACWDKVKSHASVDVGLDVIDYLIDVPCADSDSREHLWYLMQEFLIKDWPRLDKRQKLLAIQYSSELTGTSGQFPEYVEQNVDIEDDVTVKLNGKKLAIYTLTEGAGKRAKAVLEVLYPGLDVLLNHDKTATKSLTSLAENADYFVFSSKSAAHQAFYPVAERRKDLIYPSGKGSTSIVRAFVQSLENA